MINLFYCVYETGRGGRAGEEYLAKQLRGSGADGVMAVNRRDDVGYVLLRYEFKDALSMSEVEEHFKNTTEQIGKLSDKIGHELAIELKVTFTGTVVTPDLLAKKKETDECSVSKDSTATEDGKKEEDEWADVLRLRDLSSKH